MTTEDAAKTARDLYRLMDTAAFGTTFGPSVRDCQNRASAALTVQCFLEGRPLYGGMVTRDEAKFAARHAWPQGVPADISDALS